MKTIHSIVLAIVVLVAWKGAAAQAAGIGLPPFGGWETTWKGYGGAKGLAYFNFTTNNTTSNPEDPKFTITVQKQ